MDDALKRFYSEDASYKKLSHADQIRIFASWSRANGLHRSLVITDGKTPGWLRLIAGVTGFIFSLSVFTDIFQWGRLLFLPAVLSLVLFHWTGRSKPKIEAEQVGDGDAEEAV